MMNEKAESSSTCAGSSPGREVDTLLGTLTHEEMHRLFDGLRERLVEVDDTASAYTVPIREPLTPRESEVLTLVASGYTRAEVARALSISRNTAATHVASIYRKLEVGSIAEATRFAIREGIVQLV